MKHYIIIFLIIIQSPAFAQLSEDFSDGNFSLNPTWTGSNAGADFVISGNQLRSNSIQASSNFYLSTANTLALNAKWEFQVNLQFSTSGANYTDIYLLSDKADLKSSLINGYFVRIGNTDDEISLYKRSGPSSSNTKIIDGINSSVASAANTVRIRVSRSSAGLFKLEREILSSNSAYITEGSATDLSFTASTHFGIYIQQSTASFFQKHFFDNIRIDPIVTDTIPPVLNSAVAIDSNTIELTFNESMDSVSVKAIANFFINNTAVVSQIQTTGDPSRFRVTLVNGLVTATYSLSLQNVKDINGNMIGANNTATFSFIKPYLAKYGDMVINEIFPDPSPQLDLPSVEFAELRNNTEHIISLKNWKFSDPGSSSVFGDITIEPGSFLILCAKADTAEFKQFGKVLGLSPWPSLNNSSDAIKLVSSQNVLIDSVGYSDSWYRDAAKKTGGWTLERVDPKSKCEGSFNWRASVDSSGGTPGRENSSYLSGYDQIMLTADSMKQVSDTALKVYFNKHLNSATLISENFNLAPASGIVKRIISDTEFKEVLIVYDHKFLPGTDYSLFISNLKDCSGIVIENSKKLTFMTEKLPAPVPERSDTSKILITEIFADPSPEVGLPLAEFIEIFNPSQDTVDLDKWTISDPATKASLSGQKILPRQYIILCRAADTLTYKSFGKTIGLSPWPSLGNRNDKIVLKSFKARLVDSVTYSDSWYHSPSKKQGGWSLEKIDLNSACEDFFNWTASKDTSGGTPGRKNSVYVAGYDLLPLRADSLKLSSDTTIKIYFNKHLDSSTLIAENFALTPQTSAKKILTDPELKSVTLTYTQKFKPETEYLLTISNLKDCSKGVTGSQAKLTFKTAKLPAPIPERTDTSTIIVTEIFADPSPEVGLPLAEFIEIFNPSNDTVDLDKWTISDPATKASLSGQKILPRQYIILCRAADTLTYKSFGKTIGLSPWPSLGNRNDKIVLKSFKARLVDSVTYSDSWYHSPSKKQGGWSLEKIDLNSACEDFFNWTASKDTSGGTPGRKNSVYVAGYDLLPLRADSLKQSSDTTIKIYFNKHLDSSTLIAENFALTPQTSAKKILTDPELKSVTLTYTQKFKPETEYLLTISNLKDCSKGVTGSQAKLTFKTAKLPVPIPERTDTSTIIVTEIFADPSPEVGLPLAEFIEIFNPSNDTVDLDKWTISDPATKASLNSQKILPLQYIILCPAADTLTYKSFGKTIGLSPWPSLGNGNDKIVLKSFKARLVDSVTYSDSWYHSPSKKQGGWSLEKIDLNSACEDFFNWTASIDTSGGTPGRKNSVYVARYDLLPLRADSLKQTSDTTIKIHFNKHLDRSTLIAGNFSLATFTGTVKKIIADAEVKEVTITYDRKFSPATKYQLVISHVKDCSGTVISSIHNKLNFQTAKVPLPIPERADTSVAVITEIFADPSPEIGLPLAEFIEIFNPSSDTVDLNKWVLSDGSTESLITNNSIAPGEYLILCPVADTLMYKSFGKTKGLSPWPSLGNNGDQITLKSFKQRLVDSIVYSDKWYKDPIKKNGGWSLEKIDPLNKACNGFYNWTVSTDLSGGTPGRINSSNKPGHLNQQLRIDSAQVSSDSTLVLYLNSSPDTSYLNPSQFTLDNKLTKAKTVSHDLSFKKLYLEFDSKFREGSSYLLTADSLLNCGGRLIINPNNQVSFSIPLNPEIEYPILINEIFADPTPAAGLPDVEFIELYNPTDMPVSLAGLNYGNQRTRYKFNSGMMPAGSYLILCAEKDTMNFTEFGKVVGLPRWPSLNNDTDILSLKNNKGHEIQRVAYSSSWYKDEDKKKGGFSLEMIDPASVCNDFQNWRASNSPSGGSPGKQNTVYNASVSEPLKLTDAVFTDSITLLITFNRAIDSLTASITANFSLNNGVGEAVSSLPLSPEFDKVAIRFRKAVPRGYMYKIDVKNITDCKGSLIDAKFNSKDILLTPKILKNDILISEILFNPRPGGADFVEIYNNTPNDLDLQELFLATTAGDTVSSAKSLGKTQLLLGPNQYLVISTDPENIKKEYRTENSARFLRIPALPAFNDDMGTVVLLANKIITDQFTYTEKMHFQLLKNFEGISLERSNLKRKANESGNFRSATSASGFATPGYKNSQQSSVPPEKEEFELSSKTFSPDNDGFEDLLQVNYHLDKPGMIANVSIFNDAGAIVKKLLKNFTLDSKGVFTWDGLNEFQSMSHSGIYIMHAEVFDTDGKVRRFRKPFALAVKL